MSLKETNTADDVTTATATDVPGTADKATSLVMPLKNLVAREAIANVVGGVAFVVGSLLMSAAVAAVAKRG